jgi:hypothetical protein
VVPPATLTDFYYVHPEFTVFGGHLVKFAALPDPALVLSEFGSVHIGNVSEQGLAADRAAVLGGFSVEFRGPQQVGVRVAYISHWRAPGEDRREGGAAG